MSYRLISGRGTNIVTSNGNIGSGGGVHHIVCTRRKKYFGMFLLSLHMILTVM